MYAAYFRHHDGLAHHRDKDGNRESDPPVLSFLITSGQWVGANKRTRDWVVRFLGFYP